jgi:hypothetical protein
MKTQLRKNEKLKKSLKSFENREVEKWKKSIKH